MEIIKNTKNTKITKNTKNTKNDELNLDNIIDKLLSANE